MKNINTKYYQAVHFNIEEDKSLKEIGSTTCPCKYGPGKCFDIIIEKLGVKKLNPELEYNYIQGMGHYISNIAMDKDQYIAMDILNY